MGNGQFAHVGALAREQCEPGIIFGWQRRRSRIAVDPSGNFWVADGNEALYEFVGTAAAGTSVCPVPAISFLSKRWAVDKVRSARTERPDRILQFIAENARPARVQICGRCLSWEVPNQHDARALGRRTIVQ